MSFLQARRTRLVCCAMLAAALAATLAIRAPGAINAQETVTVSGVVLNGTGGGAVPSGVTVLMLVSGQDGGLVSTGQTVTDVRGRFQFDQAPLLPGARYSFSADFQRVFYNAVLGPEDLSEDVQLTVYETTQDVSLVKVTRQVLVIAEVDGKDREVAAIEFVRLSNAGDRTLLPDLANVQRLSFLRFSLPPLAEELNVQSDLPGGEIISIGTGFALTSVVLPGDHSVEFSFRFPYQGDSVSYRQSLLQGADVYQVLIPERLGQVVVLPLAPLPPVNIQGTSYRAWGGSGFGPGQGIDLKLTNLPQPSWGARLESSFTGGAFWRVAIPSVLGALLASLLLFGGFRASRGEPSRELAPGAWAHGVKDPASIGGERQRRELMVRVVAELDERFQRGEVPEAEYQQERSGLKFRILEADRPAAGG
jgi:hypothetical protein